MDIVKDFIVANKDLINTKLEEWVTLVVGKLEGIDKANIKKAFKKITEAIELMVKTLKAAIIVVGAMVKAFKFIVDNTGGIVGALGVIAFAMVALTATVVTLGAALGVATGGLSILLGLAATATAATAGAIALSSRDDTPLEEKKRLARKIAIGQAALSQNISQKERAGEERRLALRIKDTEILLKKRGTAELKIRRKRLESEKKRKADAKKAAAERRKESKASLESLKSQAAFLVEDEAKAFFQDLLEEGVAVAEASARTAAFRRENISKVLATPSTIARRVVRKKEADKEARKGANLLKTLTGGRLTSKRLGTAAKQGFGAQVLRIQISYSPTFNTPVTLRGSVQPIAGAELASIMREQVGEVIDKRNAQEFRDIINASQES